MIDFDNVFANFFAKSAISDDNIRKFAEVHLERLSSNNGCGEFTQLISDTQNAYNGYLGSIIDEDKNFAIQQGITFL